MGLNPVMHAAYNRFLATNDVFHHQSCWKRRTEISSGRSLTIDQNESPSQGASVLASHVLEKTSSAASVGCNDGTTSKLIYQTLNPRCSEDECCNHPRAILLCPHQHVSRKDIGTGKWGAQLEQEIMAELARRCNDINIVCSLRGVDVLDHPQTKPLRGRMANPIDMVKGEMTSASADGGSEESTGGVAKISRISIRSLAVALFFGGTAAFVRALLGSLPPDFFDRWKRLINDQPLQEPKPVLDPQPGTVIYDCHGVIIATIVAGGYSGKRDPLKCKKAKQAPLHPSEIPSTMWQAVVASEDRRFFEHHGIDPRGLARAILSLASSGGGSTITQQVRIASTFFSYLIYRDVLRGSSFLILKYSNRVGFG